MTSFFFLFSICLLLLVLDSSQGIEEASCDVTDETCLAATNDDDGIQAKQSQFLLRKDLPASYCSAAGGDVTATAKDYSFSLYRHGGTAQAYKRIPFSSSFSLFRTIRRSIFL